MSSRQASLRIASSFPLSATLNDISCFRLLPLCHITASRRPCAQFGSEREAEACGHTQSSLAARVVKGTFHNAKIRLRPDMVGLH